MKNGLCAVGQFAHYKICIPVTQQQNHLEENHAGGPNSRRTAKPRKNLFGNDGLHHKQKKGASEDGD
jgi:hypothetical protein